MQTDRFSVWERLTVRRSFIYFFYCCKYAIDYAVNVNDVLQHNNNTINMSIT
jgi:hypothetical protein